MMNSLNEYLPISARILEIIRHTEIEYTFRIAYDGVVKPGQFFEISIPKCGEMPISVSGIGNGSIDFTIRRVGKVSGEVFERYLGDVLFIRGPYGNGFEISDYRGQELFVVAGGTGLSPVKGVVDYFCSHSEEVTAMTLIAGFKTPKDILFLEDFGRWKQRMEVILTVDCADEDMSCQIGLVTQYIPQLKVKNIDTARVIIVGPPAMMRFSAAGFIERGFKEENIWVSFERKMCCGIGKCGHCKIDDIYVCLDGPVFPYIKGKLLID